MTGNAQPNLIKLYSTRKLINKHVRGCKINFNQMKNSTVCISSIDYIFIYFNNMLYLKILLQKKIEILSVIYLKFRRIDCFIILTKFQSNCCSSINNFFLVLFLETINALCFKIWRMRLSEKIGSDEKKFSSAEFGRVM